MSDVATQEGNATAEPKRVFNKFDWKTDWAQAWKPSDFIVGEVIELTPSIIAVIQNDVARKVNLIAKRDSGKQYLLPEDQQAVMAKMDFWTVFNASTGSGERVTGDPRVRAAKELLRTAIIKSLQTNGLPVHGDEGRAHIKVNFAAQWDKEAIREKYLGYADAALISDNDIVLVS